MTEEEWLTAEHPTALLRHLHKSRGASERKYRLFACACCRRIWPMLTGRTRRWAVETAERYADGRASRVELDAARNGAKPPNHAHSVAEREASKAVYMTAGEFVLGFGVSPEAIAADIAQATVGAQPHAVQEADRRYQAALLRHIIGNPFRSESSLPQVPPVVRGLAESVYRQDQAAIGPLHDALLEAGLTEQADHFRDAAEWHPKGCWAVDALTGRK
jgi:hypothetical protein